MFARVWKQVSTYIGLAVLVFWLVYPLIWTMPNPVPNGVYEDRMSYDAWRIARSLVLGIGVGFLADGVLQSSESLTRLSPMVRALAGVPLALVALGIALAVISLSVCAAR